MCRMFDSRSPAPPIYRAPRVPFCDWREFAGARNYDMPQIQQQPRVQFLRGKLSFAPGLRIFLRWLDAWWLESRVPWQKVSIYWRLMTCESFDHFGKLLRTLHYTSSAVTIICKTQLDEAICVSCLVVALSAPLRRHVSSGTRLSCSLWVRAAAVTW